MSRNSLAFFLFIFLLILNSCNHQELIYPQEEKLIQVRVLFDWNADPEASPKTMTVFFYRFGTNTKATHTYVFDFKGKDGGVAYLRPGNYAAICYNDDSDRLRCMGLDSFETFCLNLTTNRTGTDIFNSPANLGKSNEKITYSPDYLWVAKLARIEVEESADHNQTATQSICFSMQPVVHHYEFIIHHPVNLSTAHSITASISGMAGSIYPGKGMTGEETVSHIFSMKPSNNKGELTGHLLTFGHCGGKHFNVRSEREQEVPHILTIVAMLDNNRRWRYTRDVTGQIHNTTATDCVVELDTIILPPPNPPAGSGFQPNIDDWEGQQEPIGM